MASPLNTRDMIARALRDEKTRQDNLTKLMNRNPLLTKSAATRVVNDVYSQQKRLDAELARNKASAIKIERADRKKIEAEVFRNKVSNIKIERAERVKAEKDAAKEAARQEMQKKRAVRTLMTSARQLVVGAVAVGAASVGILTRTAQHFSPATAIRFERAMGALAATVGEVLAPAFLKLTRFVEDLADWVANLSPSTKAWISDIVTIAAPLAIVVSFVGAIGLGVMTIAKGLWGAVAAARALIGPLMTARAVAATTGVGAGGLGAGAGVGAAAAGGAGLLARALPFLGAGLGAQAIVSSVDPQPERKPWHSKAPGMLGWTSDAVRGAWTKATTGRSLQSEWESDPRNRGEKRRRLESANYPVQTLSSVLDAGRSFRQQSAQQSSLKTYEDYRQDGEIKVSEKDAKNSIAAGLNASIMALNAAIAQAVGEFRTAR